MCRLTRACSRNGSMLLMLTTFRTPARFTAPDVAGCPQGPAPYAVPCAPVVATNDCKGSAITGDKMVWKPPLVVPTVDQKFARCVASEYWVLPTNVGPKTQLRFWKFGPAKVRL